MRFARFLATTLGIAMVLIAVLSCYGDKPAGPISPVEGAWSASTFLLVPSGQSTIDVLSLGGSLTITLSANGTTTGQLAIPASVPGGPLTASMAGTYTFSNDTVRFDQGADTFVRDLPFALQDTNLVGLRNFGSATIAVVLSRQ